MNNIGTCYELGHGTEKDIQLAFDYYHQAAVKGNVQAMSNLGFMYFRKAKQSNDED